MPNIASGRQISGFLLKISRFKNKFRFINFQYSKTIIDWWLNVLFSDEYFYLRLSNINLNKCRIRIKFYVLRTCQYNWHLSTIP